MLRNIKGGIGGEKSVKEKEVRAERGEVGLDKWYGRRREGGRITKEDKR